MSQQIKVLTMYIKNSDDLRGGSFKRHAELMKGFLSQNWEVHHISPKGFSNITHKNLHHYGVYDVPLRPSYLPFTLQAIPVMLKLGRKIKIDAIVTFSMFDALMGLIFKAFHRGTKVILCDRGSTVTGLKIDLEETHKLKMLSFIITSILKRFEGFVHKKADLVIFNSEARKEELTQKVHFKQNKVKVIHNNANPSWVVEKMESAMKASPEIRKKWQGKKLVSFVGHLCFDGRDLLTLIRAFKIVKDKIPEALLLIVGDGPDKRKLTNLKKSLNLDDEVILNGWQDNPLSYMLVSDIVVVTALHEGFSNTVLEALYCEALVIGSAVGGIPEALKYEELLFPPRNEKILAEKIISLLNDTKRQEALKLIRERKQDFIFDWTTEMVNAVQAIL